MQDPAAAVKELRRAVNNYGMLGGILPAEGLPLPPGHRQYWPIFQEADKLGCTVSIHSCNSVNEHFARKDLSREAKRKIIYDNAKRFYGL